MTPSRPSLRLDINPRLRPSGPGIHGVMLAVVTVAIITLACSAGAPVSTAGRAGEDGAGVRVVATTTVFADLVERVGGERTEVTSLVPAGGEVHTFDPSPGDVTTVAEADLVVLNGVGLDEWARDLAEGSGTSAEVVELAEDLPGVEYLEGGEHGEEGESPAGDHAGEAVNPHLWLDVEVAGRYAERLVETLVRVDPEGANAYRANGAAYAEELAALDADIAGRIGAIPEDRRRIVSFHEAFPYFAAAYGLEIVGVVVEAPGQDPSAGEISALVDAIRTSGATAVFSEAQFDDRLARAIAEEAGVTVESRLYNDSLGEPPADSYVGMMRWNADRIVEALE